MCVERAAACPIDVCASAISAGFDDFYGLAKRDLLADTIDSDTHAFARYGACHEHDLSVMPREHASAGNRFVDGESDLCVGSEGHICNTRLRGYENSFQKEKTRALVISCWCVSASLCGLGDLLEERSKLAGPPEILGMPLHRDAESRRRALDGLDDPVGRRGRYGESVRGLVDRLMMAAVDLEDLVVHQLFLHHARERTARRDP